MHAMLVSPTLSKATRHWGFVVLGGAVGFAGGLAGFAFLGTQWMVEALTAASTPAAATLIAAPFALGTAALAGLFVISQRRAQNRSMKAALNHMTQGLCVFDNAARLVLCNERYIEMYRLSPDLARLGTPLRELLTHRIAAGTFSGDPDRYLADCHVRWRMAVPKQRRLRSRTAVSFRWSASRWWAAAGSQPIPT